MARSTARSRWSRSASRAQCWWRQEKTSVSPRGAIGASPSVPSRGSQPSTTTPRRPRTGSVSSGPPPRRGGNRVGMLQSRIVFKQRPDQTNSTGVLLFRNGTIVDRAYEKSVRADESVEEIFCVSAGAALYRRAMLEDIRLASGFFDRTFFMYFEDVDLGWRGRLAGWSAVYVPSARVLHAFQGSSSRR